MTLRETSSRIMLPILILATATCCVYAVTRGHEFIPNWDDYPYVLENWVIRGFGYANFKAAFTGYFVGNYAPVQIISYMVDYLLWGLKPAGYLVTNILCHILNGVLLYLLLLRLRLEPFPAGIAAAIFLLHPVQVETVAWISQRKNLLAMLFFLVALWQYISWREQEGRRFGHYLLSLLALALALLSKSVAVIFPLVILLYDLCFGDGESRRLTLRDKLPYLAVAALVAFLALISQSQEQGGGRRGFPGGSPVTTLFTMLPVLAAYLGDCLYPHNLSPYYMTLVRKTPDMAVLLAALLVIVLIALGVLLFRRNRRLFFYYAVFFAGLIPVSQIVPLIPLKHDRYLYFPMLGFAGLVAELLTASRIRWPGLYRPLLVVVTLLVLVLPVLSRRQAEIWQNDLTLWGYAVRVNPENRVGWLMLIKGYTLRGDGARAVSALQRHRELRDRYGPLRGWEDQ
jgi:hypothetical protein